MPITLDGTNGITTNSGTVISASTIGVGGATPSTSGAGITFPATQSASSDANTLDDYEEGTWTPVLTPNSGSITSQTSYGYYTKVGNIVTAVFCIRVVTGGTASGVGYVSGLPFTTQSVTPAIAGSRVATASVREDGLTGNWYFAYVWSNATQMTLTTSTNGALSYTDLVCYVANIVYRAA